MPRKGLLQNELCKLQEWRRVIKNKVAEGTRLPQIQRKITVSNNQSYQYINFSAYVDISGNVSQRLPVANFDLELEEPELSWEELQQGRRG